ncbi:MAG: response regulator transcription factor, partial [Candidatus Paceibacterota bacterium]
VIKTNFPDFNLFTAINKTELFKLLNESKIDILIQDVKFGVDHALDFIDELKTLYPETRIIFLTSVSDSVNISKLGQRVSGYILKSESLDEIINAIQEVCLGNAYYSEQAKAKMEQLIPIDDITLTRREREVLEVIMQEKSTKEIAEILSISEKTVELHRSNLFVKLDVKNLTGLIKKTIGLNLLDK